MKIGLSYSRCVRDIVDGVVDIDDVLIIIARTNFDPHYDLASCIGQEFTRGHVALLTDDKDKRRSSARQNCHVK